MIIGLTGLKGSGKDTVAAYLMKEHSFERRAFADPVKRSLAALFDIPMWEIEKWKNDDTVFATIGNKNKPNFTDEEGSDWLPGVDFPESFAPSNMWSPIREHSFRTLLQRYGTESHRDVFGENFWVDQTLPVEGFYIGRAIVVTDCRFQNEANRIKQIDGYVVRVLRDNPDIDNLHRSETEQLNIACDYQLKNYGTITELHAMVEEMLEHFAEHFENIKWPGEK